MWFYDESGYLQYVKLSEIETCKNCRQKFMRKIEAIPFSSIHYEDKCPHCGYIKGVSNSIVFINEILKGAV